MKKLGIISLFMFLFINVLSMENTVQPKKVTRKRKDKQLEELISLQKTTNQLLLLQIEQTHLLSQYQNALLGKQIAKENELPKYRAYYNRIESGMQNLYQKYGINP